MKEKIRWIIDLIKWQILYKLKSLPIKLHKYAAKSIKGKGSNKSLFGAYEGLLVIRINHSYAGFFAYFIYVLNQLRYCERYHYYPDVYFGERSGDGENAKYDKSYGDNMWEYYFYPVADLSYSDISRRINDPKDELSENDITQLSTDDLWYLHKYDPESIYGYPYGFYNFKNKLDPVWYKHQRGIAHYYVEKYIRVKTHISNKVNDFWEINKKNRNVLGVHIRGTDKGSAQASDMAQRKVEPQEYFIEIDKYIKQYPSCVIFVATDQQQYLDLMKSTYGEKIICHDAIRSTDGENTFQKPDGSNYKKGEDALIDCLLLARCDFLLKCTSHLSETALYFNPNLKSIDMNYGLCNDV